ncbi:Acetyltransferase [Desulfosporosinus sp. I2]|uniref:GNAT family N-acetyltransferase n=1 Tax=Desulfosporosinus sp. I2 TaxID=1617025 RepID=UPI0005EFE861|nr:GNAT family N-acetyltransferase [Desulfosporosinus sp. I2]KJR49077.1 Acetyltransferase [Desulfosporosinus sp. I2]
MSEIRLAQKGDTVRQKEIWKRCFGDPDSYIDFYYANRYREDETAVLLQDGEISAMITMISVRTVLPDKRNFNTAMLYAIATHPQYQNRGFATQLMDFSNRYLRAKENEFSVLVPAKMQLFDYYRKQGYQDGFYIREALLLRDRVDYLPIHKLYNCTISSITPEEYNRRRNIQLRGRLFISYHDEDIAYQKRLSQQSGADIYALDIEDIQGCLTLERITSDRVFIKEILLPEDYIYTAIKQIILRLSAKEYVLRTPSYLGEKFGGSVRPFGMIRIHREVGTVITSEDQGYLGLAFD